MSLHNGLDTVAIVTYGVYTKTYGDADPDNIANLFASYGFLENIAAIAGGAVHGLIRMCLKW